MKYAIAVLDIGMTNKKVFVYDDRLKVVDSISRTFDPIIVNGIETNDLAAIETWFYKNLSAFARKYPVMVIAVTTHGASFVCVDVNGDPCVPCVYYTHDPGAGLHDRFYKLLGSPAELQKSTGTPNLSLMINPTKGMLFAKETFPAEFSRTKQILFYPQYWGFRLTGNAGLEPTYVGCHTYLWDYAKGTYSVVADKLGIKKMLPEKLEKSWSVLGKVKPGLAVRLGLDPETIVTMGIHDSNASLLPYLAKQGDRDFVLDSTGSWCVVMHPTKKFGFEPDDIGKVVFFNQSAMITPVKTAIFTGGLEFDLYSTLLRKLNATNEFPPYRPELYRKILAEKRLFILPELIPGSGQFASAQPRIMEDGKVFPLEDVKAGKAVPEFFSDYPVAVAVLNLSLVIQTTVALRRVGLKDGSDIYVEGGFRKNTDYNSLLASWYGKSKVCLTNIKEATSFGAAMTGKMAYEGVTLESVANDFEIDFDVVGKEDFADFKPYIDRFLELA